MWDGNKNSVTLNQKDGGVKEWVFKNANQNMFKTQTKHFLDCIENNKKPKVTVDNGIEVLKIIQAARTSQKEKQKIEFK